MSWIVLLLFMTLALLGDFLKELRLPTSCSLENIFEVQAREGEDEQVHPLRRQDAMVGRSLTEVIKLGENIGL